jgi:hypothetical protein
MVYGVVKLVEYLDPPIVLTIRHDDNSVVYVMKKLL